MFPKTLLTTLDYTPSLGGVANYWHHLAEIMPAESFFVLAPAASGQPVETRTVRKKLLFYHGPLGWLKLLYYIVREQQRLGLSMHIAAQVLPVGTALYVLKLLGLIPAYMVSCHGLDIAKPRGRKRWLIGKILHGAEKVMANSYFTAGLVKDFGITEKRVFVVQPCPQIFDAVRPDENVLRAYADKQPMLLTVARLTPRKGIDSVIRSLPRIWQARPDLYYIIVGAGSDEVRLRALIEENIPADKRQQVLLVGPRTKEELAAFYQRADIFILTPRDIAGDIEGFGMVYLEAGLFRLPVIATDSGGVAEAVKADVTGLLLTDSSTEAIVKSVLTLLNDEKKRNSLGEQNFQWARSFTWTKQADILKMQINQYDINNHTNL